MNVRRRRTCLTGFLNCVTGATTTNALIKNWRMLLKPMPDGPLPPPNAGGRTAKHLQSLNRQRRCNHNHNHKLKVNLQQ